MAIDTAALAPVELRHSRHELHRRLNDEQRRWLADLYRANASAVYFVCQFLLRKPDEAADATQEVFLRAAESLRGRSTTELARSWLLTAAQNHCLEVLRRHPQVDKPTPDPIADSRGEADPEAAVVERALITAVLGELRVRERRALLLWAVERRPLAGIARELGLSYTAVQQLLFRARRHAASVAARVATALLGLSQLGRFFRWASHAGQMVLVATLVPVVLASMVSSTPHPDPPPQGGSAISSPTLPSPGGGGNLLGLTLPPNRGREKTMTVVEVSGVAVSVPSISVPGATSAINRAVKDLERSLGLPAPRVPTLPSPGAGGNLLP